MAVNEDTVSYELSDQYLLSDFPSKYRDMIIERRKDAEEFAFISVQEIFQSGEYKGGRIAEVGCGPTIHSLAIPSKYYDEIVTSDYTIENVESVRKWVAGDPDALDWTPILEVAAEIEGYSDIPSGVREIQDRLRERIKSVVRCNVLKESIFDPAIEEVDLLITAGCLEGVCPTLESFQAALQYLGRCVKRGGHILIFTVLGMSVFDFYGEDLKVLDVDEDFVINSIEEAGFSIEHQFYKENDKTDFDCKGRLLIMAKKL